MKYTSFIYPLIFFILTNIVLYFISFEVGYIMSLVLLVITALLVIKGIFNLFIPIKQRIVFHKGFHRPFGIRINPYMYIGKDKEFVIRKRYLFNNESYFSYGNEIDYQENKLFGISYRLLPIINRNEFILGHHYDSVRISWRWLKHNEDIFLVLSSYIYDKGSICTTPICMIELKDTIDISVSIELINGLTTFKVIEHTTNMCKDICYRLDFNYGPQLKTFGYYLSEYIGGLFPAKQKIVITKLNY